MKPAFFAPLFALALAACGSADPCTAPTTGVSLHPASLQELNVTETKLDCTGTAGGASLACTGGTTLTKTACDDGFAIALENSGATVLLHFANQDHWTAGGQLANGTALSGSLSIAGLGAYEKTPPANTTMAGSFDFLADQGKVNGTFTTTW